MRRLALILTASLALAACAPRASLMVVPVPEGVGTRSEVFVATTRGALADEGPESYARGDLGFARFQVSIPPDHVVGKIDIAGREQPDPQRHMVMAAAERDLSPPAFEDRLERAFRARGGQGVLYVHGFNNVAADGVFRIAQLSHDIGVNGVLLSYSWPSAGNPLGYAHDRDSALHSRDALAETLRVVSGAGGRDLLIVAHSMGSLLTMEALRTLALQGRQDILDRLSGVILIAPDIDVDVFRAQAAVMKRLPQPFIIFTSGGDRALRLSARISGESNRLGTLDDIAPLETLPITVLDVTEFEGDSGTTHFVPGSSPQLIRILGQLNNVDAAFQRDAPARAGLLPGTVLTVQNATRIILSPVAALGGASAP